MSPQSLSDRNLLFGIFALQMDFIDRDDLLEGLQAWVLEKSKPLEEILIAKGFIAETDCALLLPLIERHIEQHGKDPGGSLQTLSSVTPSMLVLPPIDDANLQKSLASLKVRKEGLTGTPTVSYKLDSSRAGVRYLSLRPHARGGLGEVFIARDMELDREVALKEIQSQHADDQNSRSRFLIEAEITGKLEHPGIVPIYGLGTYANGRPFYAMRFIQGESLQHAIQEYFQSQSDKKLGYQSVAFRRLLGRYLDVCQAVGFAHSRGVLHRDLKPGNVMLGKHGETLVVDWGLAKLTSSIQENPAPKEGIEIMAGTGSEQTLPGSAIGTPGYMSPEQAQGEIAQLGPATDVYGLGAILFALLTGQRPIPGTDTFEIVRRTREGDFPSPRQIAPSIPKALEAICIKAMALSPKNRYQSCEQLAEDVENYLSGEPIVVYREPFVERARRWGRKHRTLAMSLGAAGLVGILALLIGFLVVAGLNQKLERQNSDLFVANQKEQQQRKRAEQKEKEAFESRQVAEVRRKRAVAQEIVANLNALMAEDQTALQIQARQEADRLSIVANKRLEQANEVASELLYIVERKLNGIPAASSVRRELLDRAEKLLKSLLVEANNDALTLHLRANQLRARGDVAFQYEDLNAARAYYQQSLEIFRELVRNEKSDNLIEYNTVVVLERLGKLSLFQQNLSSAKKHLSESLARGRRLADAKRTSRLARLLLAGILVRSADLSCQLGDNPLAELRLEEGTKIYRGLIEEDPTDGESVRLLAFALMLQGELAADQGKREDSQSSYQESIGLLRGLSHADPSNASTQSLLATVLKQLGSLSWKHLDLTLANSCFLESLAIREKLSKLDPQNVQRQYRLAVIRGELGTLYSLRQDYESSRLHYRQSLVAYEKLIRLDPDNATRKVEVCVVLNNLGLLEKYLGDLALAEEYYLRSLKAYRELTPVGSVRVRDGLSKTLNNLGDLTKSQLRFKEAKSYFDEALEIRKARAESEPGNILAQREYGRTLMNLGDVAYRQKQFPLARQQFEITLTIYHKLTQTAHPAERDLRELGKTYVRLGAVGHDERHWDAAQKWYEKAIEVFDQMIETGQGVEKARNVRLVVKRALRKVKIQKWTSPKPAFTELKKWFPPKPAVAEKPAKQST